MSFTPLYDVARTLMGYLRLVTPPGNDSSLSECHRHLSTLDRSMRPITADPWAHQRSFFDDHMGAFLRQAETLIALAPVSPSVHLAERLLSELKPGLVRPLENKPEITTPTIPPLLARAFAHPGRVAIVSGGKEHTYRDLLTASHCVASSLLSGMPDLMVEGTEARVAFAVAPGFEYAASQWGIWRAGGIAVPLCLGSGRTQLARDLDLCQADILLVDPQLQEIKPDWPAFRWFQQMALERGIRLVSLADAITAPPQQLPNVDPTRRAMILFTSGTTGTPKGVVFNHQTIEGQLKPLIEAWGWTPEDRILSLLPYHHLHGILNVLCCALWSGATCDMMPFFSATKTWERILNTRDRITLLMAVPSIYRILLNHYDSVSEDEQRTFREACRSHFRLVVVGSEKSEEVMLKRLTEIFGQRPLNRAGMTETGMNFTDPMDVSLRRPGTVGRPLPGIQIRTVELEDETREVGTGQIGHLLLKGDNICREYWRDPKRTQASFTTDGWFRTGDAASVDTDGYVSLKGRLSKEGTNLDIFKCGGELISTVEVEAVLAKHPKISEAYVIGLPDPILGVVPHMVVVAKTGQTPPDDKELIEWLRPQLARHALPRGIHWLQASEIPRTDTHKVQKVKLVAQVETQIRIEL